MKNNLTIILFIFAIAPLTVFSQQLGNNALLKKDANKTGGFNPQVTVSLGSSFGSFAPAGYHSFGTWIMPEISVPVTNRFSVSAGLGYSTFFSSFSGGNSMLENSPQQYGSVYVRGNYQINDHLTISATGYKTFNLQPQKPKETINPHALDLSNEGVMINLNYKVNDNFEINAAFSYDKRRYNPYYSYPGMMNNGFNSPAMGGFGGFRPGF